MADKREANNGAGKTQHELDHPYGTTLLSRDKPENRAQWGPSGIGYIDVAPTVCTSDGQCPHYNYRADATREGGATTVPVHMLIASFRDRLCPRTIHNAFHRAENPNRVFIRIIEQTKEGSDLIDDAGCWDRYCQDYNTNCAEYKDNVRTAHVSARDAKGPTDARSKLSAMVNWDYVHRDEPDMLDFQRVELNDFCMQIDSHMDFSDNYDTELVFMFHRTQNDYAVLSTYVTDISENNKGLRIVPNLCMVTFTSTIRNWGTKECRNLIKPKMTNAMWGAGLSFHRCHAEINVPVDPYLDGVFDGEEGSRGLRFFTFGYDVYSPDTVLVTHDYHNHQSNPVVHTWGRAHHGESNEEKWVFRADIEKERPKVQTIGTKRVNMVLGIGKFNPNNQAERTEIDRIRKSRYGVGNKRTLEQASEFSGIDLAAKKMVENKCGNLVWVPYEESPEYGVEETLTRSLVGDDSGSSVATAAVPNKAAGIRGAGAVTGAAVAAAAKGTGTANTRPALPRSHDMDAAPAVPTTTGDASIPAKALSHTVGKLAPRRADFTTKEVSLLPLLAFAVSVAIVLICIVARLNRRKSRKNARHKH
mmetsp:Transcript_29219/g.64428  ORF Transcript_29219/g.64428 Transcript_29219/m.64428 type:complete len:588 (-) Transcript_29219:49-1812(-)